jgi:hypothetical protein
MKYYIENVKIGVKDISSEKNGKKFDPMNAAQVNILVSVFYIKIIILCTYI